MENNRKVPSLFGTLYVVLALFGFFSGAIGSGYKETYVYNYVGVACLLFGFIFILVADTKKKWGKDKDAKISLALAFVIEIAGLALIMA